MGKIKKKIDIWTLFDKTIENWKWFVIQYFGNEKLEALKKVREEKDMNTLNYELTRIWFLLPGGRFNIMMMPPGWSEFLGLMETIAEEK